MNRYSVFIVLGLAWTCSGSNAQTKMSPLDQMLWTRPRHVADWTWVKQPWKGNSKPYVRIAHQINVAFTDKKRIEAVTQRYRAAAEAKPTDPLAVYAWGYAAYVARPLGATIAYKDLPKLRRALALPKNPKTYEFSRLRFVIIVRSAPYAELKPLGYALLKREPNDHDVLQGMVNLLAPGSPLEQGQAVGYAQRLVQLHPNLSTSYASLGWAYNLIFAKHKDVAAGDKAVAAYHQAVALSDYPQGRRNVQYFIDRIQQMQKQLRRS
jgi:hypothetical protein